MTEEEQNDCCNEDVLASVALLYQDENGCIKWSKIQKVLLEEGLDLEKDPRTKKIIPNLKQIKPNECTDTINLSICELKQVFGEEQDLLCQGLLRSLVIKCFRDFTCLLQQLYDSLKDCTSGEIKMKGDVYQVSGDEWCVSLVSIDGQQVSFCNNTNFTLDEICGPLINGLAVDLLGENKVNNIPSEISQRLPDRYSKSESSSGSEVPLSWFLSDLALVLMCSKIKAAKIKAWTQPMKHDYVLSYLKSLCCGEELRFSNSSYSLAKESNCSAIATAHFIKAFTKTKDLIPHVDSGLDLFLQLTSMEVTTKSLAMIGAVLANGGVSPFDKQEILSEKAVSGLLNAMYSGGFRKSTSSFAVHAGVPGICSESGAVLVVIPGVLGLGLYSPRVECCCSVRAFNFLTDMVKLFRLHPYCCLNEQVNLQQNKNMKKQQSYEVDPLWQIFTDASNGDLKKIQKCVCRGLDLLNLRDPSGLTLLHIAAAHGHLDLVQELFCRAPELLFTYDIWGRKPSDYSKATGKEEVTEYLVKLESMTRASLQSGILEPVE